MRHSKPELTANIYTDPKLLDVAGAIEALTALAPSSTTGTIGATTTGTDGKRQLVPGRVEL
jgi:hypothetical protein